MVKIICVSDNSFLDNYISPVNSLTFIPKYFNLFENLSTISDAKAFIGEIYTILNSLSTSTPSLSILFSIYYNMVNRAIFVLPAPVGAQTNKFSLVLNAELYI